MGMVRVSSTVGNDRVLTSLQEHVPRSSALLPTPFPHEPMDPESLPSRRNISFDCHKPGFDASPLQDAEECFIS